MNQKRIHRKMLRKRNRNTLIIIIILVCIFALQVKPAVLEAHTPLECIAVIVEEGDSLWEIAQGFTNNQMDIRQYINVILEHNQKETAEIYPGDILEIPLYSGNIS